MRYAGRSPGVDLCADLLLLIQLDPAVVLSLLDGWQVTHAVDLVTVGENAHGIAVNALTLRCQLCYVRTR